MIQVPSTENYAMALLHLRILFTSRSNKAMSTANANVVDVPGIVLKKRVCVWGGGGGIVYPYKTRQ